MARGGINKRLVKEARDAVLAKGVNPSIDSVRVQLGNTGSKTTIHRYMKELEETEGTRLDDQALLSGTIKDLVASLAANLHSEAKAVVDKAEVTHKNQQQEWYEQEKKQKQALSGAEDTITRLEKELAALRQQQSATTEELRVTALKNQRIEQQLLDFSVLSEEKDRHIQSLEEKHQHARAGTEHYRQSVKEQRDQDQRRHEQQIQLLQTEQRQLNQTLSIKQSDITHLNKENSRLVTEVSEARKQISPMNVKIQSLEKKLNVAETNVASLTTKRIEQQAFVDAQSEALITTKDQLAVADKARQGLCVEIAALTTELTIKDKIFDKMGMSNNQST